MKTELQQTGGHYDANYDNFHADLYARVRRQAFGEDIGQNGWLGAREQDRLLPLLNLSQGRKLLDIACGAGGLAIATSVSTSLSISVLLASIGALVGAFVGYHSRRLIVSKVHAPDFVVATAEDVIAIAGGLLIPWYAR